MKLTNCKLSKKVQLKLLEFFVLEVTARAAADLLEIHPNSAALFYTKIRKIISYYLEQETLEILDGEIELDESYFGGTRKGKRGRGAADHWHSYNALDVAGFCHYRINHSNQFANGHNHINGIENF
ncbi:hypothetical protein GWI33_011826 [Rhynchophorus ferrugineus]|uniref:Transposase n=1 Tax=Rhynchophorus ferrugineus TaxID=354439 RepID=A0A834IC86_RHYFE|nr:hypothetical protein GWI33_011826 [Rhynchophorus ferrugineus]